MEGKQGENPEMGYDLGEFHGETTYSGSRGLGCGRNIYSTLLSGWQSHLIVWGGELTLGFR